MENVYLIISISEWNKVDLSKILTTSLKTCLYLDKGQKLIIKWRGKTPDFVSSLDYKEGPFNNLEIKKIIKGRGPVILDLATDY